METNELSIDSVRLGPLPIIDKFLNNLGIEKAFADFVAGDARDKIPVGKTLAIILRNIILERYPLYKIGEWAVQRGLVAAGRSDCFNDDRIGRSLQRLFDADRASLVTTIIVNAIKTFQIDFSRIHNDSTTVTFQGEYTGYPDTRAAKPKRGINKDHRPDLKQVLFSLSVAGDEAVPLYFKVWDGNITDDTTHIRNWMALRTLVGSPKFTYIADSKLCVRDSLLLLHSEGGFFVTVVPETRKEISQFQDWIQGHTPAWKEASREPNPRRKHGPPHVFWTLESPFLSSEGFRIIWVKSSQKLRDDEERRTDKIAQTEEELTVVADKKYRNREKLEKEIVAILDHYQTQRYFHWQIVIEIEESYKQEQRGRPHATTKYRKIEKKFYRLTWSQNPETIRYDARYDGIFPLITNREDPSAKILKIYKFQPRLEKRHEQLKSVYNVAPVFLKNPERVEAMLLLYFLALLCTALIERTVRKAMRDKNLPSIPIYPEDRECKNPTADKILALFNDLRMQFIKKGEALLKVVPDNLSKLQLQVLGLLGMKESDFFDCGR
jgi:transposase